MEESCKQNKILPDFLVQFKFNFKYKSLIPLSCGKAQHSREFKAQLNMYIFRINTYY